MKVIPLTKGQVACVDDEDFERVSQHNWAAQKSSSGFTFYAFRWGPGGRRCRKRIYMHRDLAGAKSGQDVDHKDGNGLLNTRANLRLATRQQNQGNRRIGRNNSSGYKGVSWSSRAAGWVACICVKRAHRYLGNFKDPIAAARAYDRAAVEVFGDFALLNFPMTTGKADRVTSTVGPSRSWLPL